MHNLWPGFEFDGWRSAKLARRGIYNVGLTEWQLLLCTIDGYRDLAAEIGRYGVGLSVHHPYISQWRGLDRRQSSQFLHPDATVRERSHEWLDDSLQRAAETGARFAVTHIADANEPVGFVTARGLAREAVERMSDASERHSIEIHIEFVGYHETFHQPSDFAELIESSPRLKLCLDTGHLHRWSQIRGGDERAAVGVLAPHVGSMHIWNISSSEEYTELGHVPVHPSHRVEDGYGDIEWIVGAVMNSNPRASIVFEPTIRQETSEEFVAEGIAWVREFLGNWWDHKGLRQGKFATGKYPD